MSKIFLWNLRWLTLWHLSVGTSKNSRLAFDHHLKTKKMGVLNYNHRNIKAMWELYPWVCVAQTTLQVLQTDSSILGPNRHGDLHYESCSYSLIIIISPHCVIKTTNSSFFVLPSFPFHWPHHFIFINGLLSCYTFENIWDQFSGSPSSPLFYAFRLENSPKS